MKSPATTLPLVSGVGDEHAVARPCVARNDVAGARRCAADRVVAGAGEDGHAACALPRAGEPLAVTPM